ncbi:MAG: DUF1080 domain-containing protein [Gemmataceae bacterium]
MSRLAFSFLALLLLTMPTPFAWSQKEGEGKKIVLFNSKNLEGWKVEGIAKYPDPKDNTKKLPIWSVKEGKLFCKGYRYGFLRYAKQQFGDFHFHVEYRMLGGKRNNSGIGIRTVPFDPRRSGQTRPSRASYEIQLLDDAGEKPNNHSTGSLYRYVAPKVNKVKPAPEWNTMDIICVGPRIRVKMNGESIIDFDQSKHPRLQKNPLKGYLCVQNHGSPIEFRNLWVRDIQTDTK